MIKLLDILRESNNLSQTKIVDDSGNPLIVHRSQEDKRQQGVERQANHKGIYFSANKESTKIYGPLTKEYYLDIRNPLILKDSEWNLSVLPAHYYDYLIRKGYDGAVWLRKGEMYEIIAFYPKQVIPVSKTEGSNISSKMIKKVLGILYGLVIVYVLIKVFIGIGLIIWELNQV